MNRRAAIRAFAAVAGTAATIVVARQAQRRVRAFRAQGRVARDEYTARFPVERRALTVAGCETNLYVAGSANSQWPPLLLVHGGVIEAATWLETAAALSTDRLVVAPDLPAHGLSGYLPPAHLLHWLEALVEHLGWQRFDLCGHSMGGALSIRYAARHRQRVRRLVLCAPAGTGQHFPRVWPEPWNAGLLPFPLADTLIEKVWGQPERLTPTLRRQFDLIFSDFFLSRRWLWYGSGGWRWLLDVPLSLLPSIAAPALFVWGERDRIVPFHGRRTARLVAQISNARVHFLPSLGHLPQIESPPAFIAALREFLSAEDTKCL